MLVGGAFGAMLVITIFTVFFIAPPESIKSTIDVSENNEIQIKKPISSYSKN